MTLLDKINSSAHEMLDKILTYDII